MNDSQVTPAELVNRMNELGRIGDPVQLTGGERFPRLRRFAWSCAKLLFVLLVVGIVGLAGYLKGGYDGFVAGRFAGELAGMKTGVTVALNAAEQKGLGQ